MNEEVHFQVTGILKAIEEMNMEFDLFKDRLLDITKKHFGADSPTFAAVQSLRLNIKEIPGMDTFSGTEETNVADAALCDFVEVNIFVRNGKDRTKINGFHFVATNEPPKKPGFYWAVDKRSRRSEYEIVIVGHPRGSPDSVLGVLYDDSYADLKRFEGWIGPLPMPKERLP